MEIFIAKQNADMTEGRGPMRVIGYFLHEGDAYSFIEGKGVMGVGDGEIYAVQVSATPVNKNDPWVERKVYGYTNAITGRWRYGWVDGRDLPQQDPEWDDYIRLREKFKDVK